MTLNLTPVHDNFGGDVLGFQNRSDELTSAVHTQFLVNIINMIFYGAQGDEERVLDFFVAFALEY
jgi:hypothetical protein